MINLETRKGKPLQTKSNVLAMLHNHDVTFEFSGNAQTTMIAGGEQVTGFVKQLQKTMDLAAQHNFYRCNLKSTVHAALVEIDFVMWQSANKINQQSLNLKINSTN
ncbi:hypothetical protein VC87395_001752 [Vibrio paracholerae 87395]|uniref:hypothetical protein n=1 Tax=Vibrio paracholerae TaxID=650003 RepID=UPI0002C16396|nr:hypothetical protein [Vibrio paracholerae]EMP93033.1 hypothetical protein VC87395_001752 [Vibrio paracholerae 87395]